MRLVLTAEPPLELAPPEFRPLSFALLPVPLVALFVVVLEPEPVPDVSPVLPPPP